MTDGDVTGLNAIAPLRKGGRLISSWKVTAGVIWLLTTLALAGWWLIFGLQQITRLSQMSGEAPPQLTKEIARRHFMLLSEGLTLFFLLLAGGTALLYYIYSEVRRTRRIQEFFAAFTHDLKTSLGSLRLQAESLEEDIKDPKQAKVMRRLVKDTVRLELQLENSLLLASPDDGKRLLLEPILLSDLVLSIRYHWPELETRLEGDAQVKADSRGVESIVKNLLQNAVVHGRATKVEIKITTERGRTRMRFLDNGRGFSGDRSRLGQMFHRHTSTSGSGLGLYLADRLAHQMGGKLRVQEASSGFCVELELPEFRKELSA